MLSSDTHEVLYDPIVLPHGDRRTFVVESGEDTYVGQIDLTIEDGKVTDFTHTLHEVDDSVEPDKHIEELVNQARAPFLEGPEFKRHTKSPPGWPKDKGLTLDKPMDTVIAKAGSNFQRYDVLERAIDNFFADAIYEVSGADIAATNGFRYDVPLHADQDVTLENIIRYLPLAGHVAVVELTGAQVLDRFERFMEKTFAPNPYSRSGRWLPAIAGLRLDIDLTGPRGPALNRIVDAQVYDRDSETWQPLEEDRVYRFASCHAPGDPLDEVCRTSGGRNIKFLLKDFSLQAPLAEHQPASPEPKLQVAPVQALFGLDLINEYLSRTGKTIRESDHKVERYRIVAGELPKSVYNPNIVQPLQGVGPDWLAAQRIQGEGHEQALEFMVTGPEQVAESERTASEASTNH